MLACVSGQLPAEHADDVKDTEYQPPKSVHPIGRNVVPLNLTLFFSFSKTPFVWGITGDELKPNVIQTNCGLMQINVKFFNK